MQTLFTGFVDNEMKYPYVLMDMEQDITDANVGFNKLLELAEDNVIKYSEPATRYLHYKKVSPIIIIIMRNRFEP